MSKIYQFSSKVAGFMVLKEKHAKPLLLPIAAYRSAQPRSSGGRSQIQVYTQSTLAEQTTPAVFAMSDLVAMVTWQCGRLSRDLDSQMLNA